jgi:hypothetical protein
MKSTYRAEIISINEAIKKNLEGDNYYLCVVKFLEGSIINKEYFASIILENNKNYFNVGDNVVCSLIILEKDGKKEPKFNIELKHQTNFKKKNEKLYYITNANLKRILFRIERSDINYESEVWKIKIDFLNKLEKKNILVYKYFFEYQDIFLEKYKYLQPREDKYVYNNPSAYHDDNTCEKLLSDFNNYEIPESIRTKKEHELYRKWFNENLRLLEKNRPELDDLFKQNHYSKWGCYPIKVDLNNAGVYEYENLTLSELETLIDETLEEAKAFINSSKVNLDILSHLGQVSYNYKDLTKIKNREGLNYDDTTISMVLQYFELKIKRPLKNHLKEYYRIKNNPNLMFTSHLLSELGLKYCSSCNGKQILKQIEKPTPDENLPF